MSAVISMATRETRRDDLSVTERAEMRGLLDTYFEGVTEAQFARDLDEKDWVLRVFAEGRLVGFSTLAIEVVILSDGREVNVVYSGDTIMAPEAWGSPVLARGWIRLVRRACAERGERPGYWLLLSSGFRTYRFLPVFWRDFWPRAGAAISEAGRALRDELAGRRFGAAYDAAAGVVRFAVPQRLRERLAEVPTGRDRDAQVAFFLTANPGYSAGDELVCLTELSDDNLTAAGRRVVREAGA
ncbi:MAG: hypothetical protein NTU80_13105 [Verrucomicrobia bacterium]|nr:hypothetical protein [Verrucomicrobiota bacterium]